MEFNFRRHFRLRPKMKNAFRSASSVHHKKVLVLVLKKSLDYITATRTKFLEIWIVDMNPDRGLGLADLHLLREHFVRWTGYARIIG